jgi:hypothetical protein
VLLSLLNAHEFHAIEGPFFPSFEYDDVPIHCLNSPLMRPDFGNGAIHTDERCGYSGEDPYAVSDFKGTHNNRSPSFSKSREWQAWEQGKVGVVVRKAGAVTRITRLPQAIT